ncbi:MAG: 50S ribosomal protein L24 [Clostridia bacterium]|nr:50S ribosomal protein L24 [Clostridia bacterium]
MKMHVKKNDKVIVISGEDAGVIGNVIESMPKEGKVVVKGVNIVKKHVRPRNAQQQGGILDQEAAIYASKVMLYCDKCKAGVRVAHKINEDGSKVRVCKKCGEVIE